MTIGSTSAVGEHHTGFSRVAQVIAGMVSSSATKAIQSEPSPRK